MNRDNNGRFVKGCIVWNKGKSMPKETREKIGETHKQLYKEGKRKISPTIFKKGHKHSEATIDKLSESHKGKKLSEEHKENIIKGRIEYLKEHPEEIEKMRKRTKESWANPNSKFHSEEFRKNMTKGLKKAWKDPNSTFHSKSYKENQSNSHKRYYKEHPEAKEIKRELLKGTKQSEKTINKRSRSLERAWANPNSKFHSEEKLKKFTISMKRAWKDPDSNFYSENHIKTIKEARAKQIFPIKDTKIEVKIQNYLKRLGYEFFTHQYMRDIKHSYQCDILIPALDLVIECDGDYWHKYPIGNDLDHIRTKELIDKGFKVLRLWECEIKAMDINTFKDRIGGF